MTYCSGCGNVLETGDDYCAVCGREIVRIVMRDQAIPVDEVDQEWGIKQAKKPIGFGTPSYMRQEPVTTKPQQGYAGDVPDWLKVQKQGTGQTQKVEKSVEEDGRAVARGLIAEGTSFIWQCVWLLVFWGGFLSITFSLFGDNRIGWQVVATLILAIIAQRLLASWWAGMTRKANARQ